MRSTCRHDPWHGGFLWWGRWGWGGMWVGELGGSLVCGFGVVYKNGWGKGVGGAPALRHFVTGGGGGGHKLTHTTRGTNAGTFYGEGAHHRPPHVHTRGVGRGVQEYPINSKNKKMGPATQLPPSLVGQRVRVVLVACVVFVDLSASFSRFVGQGFCPSFRRATSAKGINFVLSNHCPPPPPPPPPAPPLRLLFFVLLLFFFFFFSQRGWYVHARVPPPRPPT